MPTEFRSYFWGGFESATHRRRDGCRVDVAASSGHDSLCEQDYALLQSAGVRTVRDALRWHRIQPTPGEYDWSTFTAMLDAAHRTGTEVIWDLCHWGVPDWVDPFSPDFIDQFRSFATAAATVLRDFHCEHAIPEAPVVCPINEVSFWSWVGGDVEHFFPFGCGRGGELKRQLVCAANAAIDAMRQVAPEIRILQPEPLIHISPDSTKPEQAGDAERHTASQYEAWDMLLGRQCPELGGREDHVDYIGVNYYWNNQWVHRGELTGPGHSQHRPLHAMLLEVWQRYGKPIVIAETSAEDGAGPGWFGYVTAEVREAERLGVPMAGICVYPVMDYPGWDDDRHCSVGLIALSQDLQQRSLRAAMVAELEAAQRLHHF